MKRDHTGINPLLKTDKELQEDEELNRLWERQVEEEARSLLNDDNEYLDLVAQANIKYELSRLGCDNFKMDNEELTELARSIGIHLRAAARDSAKKIVNYPVLSDLEPDKEGE